MNPQVIVWTKPNCVQCRLVKHRLTNAGVPYVEQDLTAPENVKDLQHFEGLGYSSAPITEYGGIAVPGFMPDQIDRVIEAYRTAEGVKGSGNSTQNFGAPDPVAGLIERSSFGTPEAQALRATVSDERARKLVERSMHELPSSEVDR